MKPTNTSAANAIRPQFIGLAILLLAAFAVAFIVVFALTRSQLAPNQPASSIPSGVIDPAVRNQRLLELNEGIQPSVATVRVDRNKRLLELNEGYAPAATRSPRDQRLYELNR